MMRKTKKKAKVPSLQILVSNPNYIAQYPSTPTHIRTSSIPESPSIVESYHPVFTVFYRVLTHQFHKHPTLHSHWSVTSNTSVDNLTVRKDSARWEVFLGDNDSSQFGEFLRIERVHSGKFSFISMP